MAIEILDGFDLYGDTEAMKRSWLLYGSPTFSTTDGRFFGGAASIAAKGYTIRKMVSSSTLATWGFALKSNLSASIFLSYFSAIDRGNTIGDANGGITLLSNGAVRLLRKGGATVADSAPGVILADTWAFIEIQIKRSSGSGTGEIFVNGVSILSGAGDFNRGSFGEECIIIGTFGTSSPITILVDDFYANMNDSAFPNVLGDCRIETLLPNADTAQADWTPLSGSGFSNIDDALSTNGDGDTSYVSETTLNNKSEFDMENLSNSPTEVFAVSVASRASKTDAGSIEYTHYIDNGVEEYGTPMNPSESAYTLKKDIFEEQPGSPSQWDEDSINNLKTGLEITA